MAKSFQVDVVSPEAIIWSGPAEFLSARTSEGDLGVLADHEPTMALLATGTCVVHHGAERTAIAVHGGFLQIFRNQVTLLSDRAELAAGDATEARRRAAELREQVEADSEEGAA